MRWLDVFGPPGVGKSHLCDTLWHPHAIEWKHINEFPAEWASFLFTVEMLLGKVSAHPTFPACLGMVGRSLRKMAAVQAIQSDDVYIQTGFAQRGLGFGWRLENPENVRSYYELMPVSLGMVSLTAPEEIIIARNEAREKVKATAHENRAFMVPLMRRAREIALEVFDERGVPLLELDTTRDPQALRRELLAFRDSLLGNGVDRSLQTVHA